MKMNPSPRSGPNPCIPAIPRTRWKFAASIITAFFLILTAPLARSASYYVDPATGSMSNPGTAASPWSTLEAVFTANKTFVAGDIIYLRSGYHGLPQVKGNNTGMVTIQPDTGAAPKLKRIVFKTGAYWTVSGLDICPENAGAGIYETGRHMVEIQSTCSNITVQNCTIKQALSIAGWLDTDWQTRLGKGSAISVAAPNSSILDNQVENVSFGISVSKTAPFTQVARNTITAFYNDGMRGLADDCVFADNLLQDSYVNDSNHDDFFQSWSTDATGAVGKGTVYRITLRGNIFISRRNATQPYYAPPQGIGCFDGMYEGWVVENNLIVSQTYHGIALYGAINCKVVNNTVVENPLDGSGNAVRPWVLVTSHKANADGTPWPVPSTGNLIRNNISARAASMVAGGGVIDHNQTTTAYTTYFTDYAGYDFSLKPTAPAVDAGLETDAPTSDIDGNPRIIPYDIGAYEYQGLPVVYEGFTYAPTTNVGTAPDSPDDFGLLGTTWTGTNDIISPGLTYAGVATVGNALSFSSNVGAVRNIDMSAFPAAYTQVDSDSVTRLGKPGSELWFRFLIKTTGADPDGTLGTGLNLNGATSGGVTKMRIGDLGTNGFWGISHASYPAVSAYSTVPIVTGDTMLMVVRVKFVAGTNNDEIDLFINPPLGPTPPATPSASLRNMDAATFDRLEAKGNRASVIDEIAIATDWSTL